MGSFYEILDDIELRESEMLVSFVPATVQLTKIMEENVLTHYVIVRWAFLRTFIRGL